MLPDFLDDQANLKPGFSLVTTLDELESIQGWLSQKEQESSRTVRPAWMEVAQALVNLSKQNLSAGKLELEQQIFETHIVAKQAAKQRGERSLQTRFVSDEIRRISSHQGDYVQSHQEDAEKIPVIGWFRLSNRRGLGIALADLETLRESNDNGLNQGADCSDDENLEQSNTEQTLTNQQTIQSPRKHLVSACLGFLTAICIAGLSYAFMGAEQNTSTLSQIKTRGSLICGVDGLLPHFSLRNDAEQSWWGLDVELCKALAAALKVEVEFVKVSASSFQQRITALHNGKVDILFRNTTLTTTKDINNNITFGPIYFYEREAFLALSPQNSDEALKLQDLAGKRVCVKPGTSNQRTLLQLQEQVDFELVTSNGKVELSDNIKLLKALRKNKQLCDYAFGNDFVLQQVKKDQELRNKNISLKLHHLPEIGLDPLAPVLLDDLQWQGVVSNTIYALIYADELGINSYNLTQFKDAENSFKSKFLRGDGMEELGLEEDWVYRIIAGVGSYNQIYYRSIECDYVACKMPNEESFLKYIENSKNTRWPNMAFNTRDEKPGMLVVPRF